MTAAQAYAEVQRLTRRRARNFAYGIMVLPRPKRRAIAAIYAFAREVDDVADGPLPAEEKRARLEGLRRALDESPNGSATLVALADARARYGIPDRALHDLVDGGLQDLAQSRYATFDELRGYCRLVAGAVGRACLPVYGGRDVARAETLGVALQLINIVRDVAEDWRLGRVYLPQDELARFGVVEEDIAAGRTGPEWRAVMEHQAGRAETLLAEGVRLLPLLDRRSALCVRTFAGIYRGLLEQMRERSWDVFSVRPHLSPAAKLRAVAAL